MQGINYTGSKGKKKQRSKFIRWCYNGSEMQNLPTVIKNAPGKALTINVFTGHQYLANAVE